MNASIRSQNDARLTWSIAAALVIMGAVVSTAAADDGMLQTIRDDVRGGAPASPAPSPSSDRSADNNIDDSYCASDWTNGPEGGNYPGTGCQNGTNSSGDGPFGPRLPDRRRRGGRCTDLDPARHAGR